MPTLAWLKPGVLTVDHSRGEAGRGVRIAVIDSGVHAGHPHIAGGAIEGVSIDAEGGRHPDFVDRIGHGTAVTAVIREKAPGAVVLAARVFDLELKATAAALIAAIGWAVEQRAHLINLSLGTTNPAHADALGAALARARAQGTYIVAAGPSEGVEWLPGSLPGAIAVALDWTLPRDQVVIEGQLAPPVDRTRSGVRMAVPFEPVATEVPTRMTVRASGYPRPVPGVPPSRNLKGLSFAVANVTGLIARGISEVAMPATT